MKTGVEIVFLSESGRKTTVHNRRDLMEELYRIQDSREIQRGQVRSVSVQIRQGKRRAMIFISRRGIYGYKENGGRGPSSCSDFLEREEEITKHFLWN